MIESGKKKLFLRQLKIYILLLQSKIISMDYKRNIKQATNSKTKTLAMQICKNKTGEENTSFGSTPK